MSRERAVLVWVCTRCGTRQDGNPRWCWRCWYTVYRPTWEPASKENA